VYLLLDGIMNKQTNLLKICIFFRPQLNLEQCTQDLHAALTILALKLVRFPGLATAQINLTDQKGQSDTEQC